MEPRVKSPTYLLSHCTLVKDTGAITKVKVKDASTTYVEKLDEILLIRFRTPKYVLTLQKCIGR